MSDHSDWNRGCDFRVLFVSGHWSAKANRPCAGIFVDRQLASLKKKALRWPPLMWVGAIILSRFLESG